MASKKAPPAPPSEMPPPEQRMRALVASLKQCVEHAERSRQPQGGQNVPYHGDFAGASPTTISQLHRWVEAFEAALSPTARKLAGYCSVDSGQLMLVDPAYVCPAAGGVVFTQKSQSQHAHDNFGYDGATAVTTKSPSYGQLKNQYAADLAVVSCTLYGDGRYPVYVELDALGGVHALTVRFDE